MEFDCEKVGMLVRERYTYDHLKDWFSQFNSQHLDVRDPLENQRVKEGESTSDWHQDCGGPGSLHADYHLLVWSSHESTELCREPLAQVIVRFPPGSLVCFHNLKWYHRTPPIISPERWFVRCTGPDMTVVSQLHAAWVQQTGCRNEACDGVASLGACAL